MKGIQCSGKTYRCVTGGELVGCNKGPLLTWHFCQKLLTQLTTFKGNAS